jgi:hypothetical protein
VPGDYQGGSIMANARISGLILGVGLALILAAGPALAVDEQRLQRFFALMDSDGDKQVSRPEFQAGKGAVFLALDADGSMTLTQNEVRLSPDGLKLLAGADGSVDGEEFLDAEIASFDVIDANDDHQIDFAELSAHVAKYSR